MSTPYQRIEKHEQVLRAFGYWPTFHDAELRAVCLDRNAVVCDSIYDATMDVFLHAFEWTHDATPKFNHHLVQLRFYGIEDLAIEGFNHQNAILELKIEDCTSEPDVPVGFHVTFVPAHGLSGSFSASGAEVLSVIPCDESAKPRKAEQDGPANRSQPGGPVTSRTPLAAGSGG